MFSSMKMDEYMESELSGIFWVKLAAKYIVFGFHGAQRQAVFAMWCLFLKKHANNLKKTVKLSVFPVKQYSSFIYTKEKSFCLVNGVFPFYESRGTNFMQ